jgi:polysaccharide biosynthesis protein PslG
VRRIVLTALVAGSLGLLLGSAPSAVARPAVPRGFFGVVPQGPLSARDFKRMHGVVGTLRIPIYWPRIEPRAGELDFSALDATVSAAAASGVRVLPFVYGTPGWLASDPARPPLSAIARSAWGRFLRALVQRYGPGGELWSGSSQMAIRRWQIWNEPNFLLFWRPRPSPGGYARLLRVSAQALRAADRGAEVVAAGLAPVEGGMLPWKFLRKLYVVPGVGRSFDMAAVHPYSSWLGGVTYQVRKARHVMAAAGDSRKPLLVSELGVASDSPLPTAFDWGSKGQALYLRRAYGSLLRARQKWHIAGVDWYAWQDMSAADPHCVFCEHAGLFDPRGKPKPAWGAFAHVAAAARAGAVR